MKVRFALANCFVAMQVSCDALCISLRNARTNMCVLICIICMNEWYCACT